MNKDVNICDEYHFIFSGDFLTSLSSNFCDLYVIYNWQRFDNKKKTDDYSLSTF